jgi:hypothetical protein
MSDASGSTETAEQGPAETADTNAGSETTDATDWQAEAKKWKELSRKNEGDARKAQGELKKLATASMTEQEKAVAEASAQGRAEALAHVAGRLVDAEVRAAAAGRGIDADALLEGLDRSRFLGDDDEPDREAVEAFLDRLAPKSAKRLDLGQGAREGSAGSTNSDMNNMLRRAAGR